MRLLRGFGLLETGDLLLQLCEEVLAGRHEVCHGAWSLSVCQPRWSFDDALPPLPHAPVLRVGTESPGTLWYTEGWSESMLVLWTCARVMERFILAVLSRYSAID